MLGSRNLTIVAVLALSGAGVLGLPGCLKHTESAEAGGRAVQATPQTIQPDTLMLMPTRPTITYFAANSKVIRAVEIDTSSFHLIYTRALADSTGQDRQEFFCVHVYLGLIGERGEKTTKERAADSSQVATMIAPYLGKSKAIIIKVLGGWTVAQLIGRPQADQAGQEIKDKLNEEVLSKVSFADGASGGKRSILAWQVGFDTRKIRPFEVGGIIRLPISIR